jgi:zinc/manganese transport system substrate-binding protein
MITVTVMRFNRVAVPLAAATMTLATLGLAGCAGASTSTSDVVHVVAAENFWGNITSQIGGRDVSVTSLITNPNADPHLFETDAADAATLAQAQVVIENGAGYDTWMGSLLGADGGSPRIVNAATVLHITGSDPNPHLWYDIPRVPTVAAAIAGALEKAAPGDAAPIKSNSPRSTRPSRRSMRHWPPSRRTFTTCPWRTPSGYPATRWR